MSTPAIDKAFQMLSTLGVPRERARSVANGIQVLDTRYQRQVRSLMVEISGLKEELAAAKRKAALTELTQLSEEMGGYDLPSAPLPSRSVQRREAAMKGEPAPEFPVHPDPTGKTREPPHCPTCNCPT